MKGFGLRAAAAAVVVMAAVVACGGGGGSNGGVGGGGVGDGRGNSPPGDGGGGSPDTPASFALTVSASGGGRVSSAPGGIDCGATCSTTFAAGTSVTLSATADAGQRFTGWSGACSGTAASCVLTMSEARSVGAGFAPATTAGGWGGGALVSSAEGGADVPKVAIDAEGRALLVWSQLWARNGASGYDVWASRYLPGSGWDAPVLLDISDATVREVQVAIDPASGRAMVSWQQLTSASAYDLWARPFDPSGGWGAAAQVEAGAGALDQGRVGLDANGNALAVWSQIGPSTRVSIWANRYRFGSGWGTPTLIENDEVVGQQDTDPRVAVAPSGDAVAVWHRSNGISVHLWSNRYTASGGWGSAGEVVRDAGTNQFIGDFDLKMDASGNALLAWGQADVAASGRDTTVWFKRFTGGAWQAASAPVAPPVQTTQGFISAPFIAMNAGGTALVAWGREDRSLLAAVAPAGAAGFGAAATIRPAQSLQLTSLPEVGVDDQGNAFYAWSARADNQQPDIWLAKLTAGSGWGAAALHESHPQSADRPTLAMNGRGDAAVAWYQFADGQGTRIAARYHSAQR